MICCWAARHASQQTFEEFAAAMLDLLKQPALGAFATHLVRAVQPRHWIGLKTLALLEHPKLLFGRERQFSSHGFGASTVGSALFIVCAFVKLIPQRSSGFS